MTIVKKMTGLTKGRRKIDIKYISEKSRRHITFSKRKAGIVKKAHELAVLTGTDVLLLIHSEAGTIYYHASDRFRLVVDGPEAKRYISSCLSATAPSHKLMCFSENSSTAIPLNSNSLSSSLMENFSENLKDGPILSNNKVPDYKFMRMNPPSSSRRCEIPTECTFQNSVDENSNIYDSNDEEDIPGFNLTSGSGIPFDERENHENESGIYFEQNATIVDDQNEFDQNYGHDHPGSYRQKPQLVLQERNSQLKQGRHLLQNNSNYFLPTQRDQKQEYNSSLSEERVHSRLDQRLSNQQQMTNLSLPKSNSPRDQFKAIISPKSSYQNHNRHQYIQTHDNEMSIRQRIQPYKNNFLGLQNSQHRQTDQMFPQQQKVYHSPEEFNFPVQLATLSSQQKQVKNVENQQKLRCQSFHQNQYQINQRSHNNIYQGLIEPLSPNISLSEYKNQSMEHQSRQQQNRCSFQSSIRPNFNDQDTGYEQDQCENLIMANPLSNSYKNDLSTNNNPQMGSCDVETLQPEAFAKLIVVSALNQKNPINSSVSKKISHESCRTGVKNTRSRQNKYPNSPLSPYDDGIITSPYSGYNLNVRNNINFDCGNIAGCSSSSSSFLDPASNCSNNLNSGGSLNSPPLSVTSQKKMMSEMNSPVSSFNVGGFPEVGSTATELLSSFAMRAGLLENCPDKLNKIYPQNSVKNSASGKIFDGTSSRSINIESVHKGLSREGILVSSDQPQGFHKRSITKPAPLIGILEQSLLDLGDNQNTNQPKKSIMPKHQPDPLYLVDSSWYRSQNDPSPNQIEQYSFYSIPDTRTENDKLQIQESYQIALKQRSRAASLISSGTKLESNINKNSLAQEMTQVTIQENLQNFCQNQRNESSYGDGIYTPFIQQSGLLSQGGKSENLMEYFSPNELNDSSRNLFNSKRLNEY